MPQGSWIVAAAALIVPMVHGHLYTKESRQYYYSRVYQDDDFPLLERQPGAYNARNQVYTQIRGRKLIDPDLLKEYGDGWWPLRWVYEKGEMAPNGNYLEPQGISVRHGVCGDPEAADTGGKEGENTYSTPNRNWKVLQTYKTGQVIEIETVMTAHHWGHLEFFICDTGDLADPGGVATQECFNKYPLTRADGDDDNSPIDPDYPGRYYVDPPCRQEETKYERHIKSEGGYVMKMKYKLPEDLVCGHCVLQTWYFTGHRCTHPGYAEFNPSSWPSQCAPNKSDWINVNLPYCGEKDYLYCEEFWQCSDIAILEDGPPLPDSIGCFHDDQADRVMGHKLSNFGMTTEMCRDHCTAQGAAFMATQYGFECWCSPDGGLDYNRHYDKFGKDAVCEMPCRGNESQKCGGYETFNLYKL